jgi:hypothetical protein
MLEKREQRLHRKDQEKRMKREAQEMGGNELEAQEDYADEPVHCDCLHQHLFLT